MAFIQRLSETLISQIAAGEVVERPASAVKELVENSIDAGATAIFVEIQEGGLKLIRVLDNGRGIPSEDLPLALERHATSKIASLEDLYRIQSLGFRGEALASLASIAQVMLKSRPHDQDSGGFIEVSGIQEVSRGEISMPVGTDISIHGLFQHTPARRKYMKSPQTEYRAIFDTLMHMALAHPGIAFRLVRDNELIFDLPPEQSRLDRITHLLGEPVRQGLIPVEKLSSGTLLSGFVGKPELSRSQQKHQFLFVNRRPIQNRALRRAVEEAFHSLLMHEQHPWFLLDLTLSPELLDVNVHPRKLEVKFENESELYRQVFHSVKEALEAHLLSPQWTGSVAQASPSLSSKPLASPSLFEEAQTIPIEEISELFQIKELAFKPLAQLGRSYILAESQEGLVLIDQHAAHERVRYTRFMEALEKVEPLAQPLLTPLSLDLGLEGLTLIEDFQKELLPFGYDIEPFGKNTILLRSVPHGLQNREPEQCFLDLLGELRLLKKGEAVKKVRETILTFSACRGAIKFGDVLTMREMEALLSDMQETEHCTHCPHGRPALVTFRYEDLETLFKRRNF